MHFKSGKKAQGVIEFVIIFAAVFFFFTLFLIVIQANVNQDNLDDQNELARDLALSVQDEINLAKKSSDGYYREFSIPEKILGRAYEINISDRRIYIYAEKIGTSYRVGSVSGNIKKGINVIEKQNGTIYLNP